MSNTFTEKIYDGLAKLVFSKKAMIISGIVCAIPFVFEKTFLLSYIMYIPLFCCFFNNTKQQKNRIYPLVFLCGFVYYAVGYSWLCELYPLDFAGFTKPEAVGVIALAVTAVPAIHSGLFTACFAFCNGMTRESKPVFKIAVFPCIFVFAEFLQTLGPLAFPWCRISIAQSFFLPSLQSASLFGSYFITYVVILVNALIGYAIINQKFAKRSVAIAVAVFGINVFYGTIRLSTFDYGADTFTAVALQGNLSSSEKWSGSVYDMVDIYLDLSDKALAEAKDRNFPQETVVLVPETAFPVAFTEKSAYSKIISEYAKNNNINFVAGAFSAVNKTSGNSLFVFDYNGNMLQPYTKRVLVPFGEYVPYRSLFTSIVPSLAEINMLSADLYAGEHTAVFETNAGKLGSAICYESIFPNLCRKSVKDGAEVLLIATNDSWFGESAALKHHLAAARMRAVENGVPVIRAANTGISALINADGSYVERLGVSQRGYVVNELAKASERTLYYYVGDSIVLVCFALTVFDKLKALLTKIFK